MFIYLCMLMVIMVTSSMVVAVVTVPIGAVVRMSTVYLLYVYYCAYESNSRAMVFTMYLL